jgi:dipeptidyl aminopeptidase/acylaminoacyl peptidase
MPRSKLPTTQRRIFGLGLGEPTKSRLAGLCGTASVIGLLGLGAVGCGESSIQDAPGLAEDSAQVAPEFSAADRRRVADALMAVADTGHCQIAHLFGGPGWAETGVCVASNGSQCRTGGARECFNERPVPNAIVATMCRYTVAVNTTCMLARVTGRIAFVTNRNGNDEIYLMKPDGSGVRRLTNDPAKDLEPAWSSDGAQLAFVRQQSGSDLEIYKMNADGSGLTRLTQDSATDASPTWSPDGTEIAFASDRSGHAQLYRMGADGSGVTPLTNSSAADGTPAWSPDGARLAFSRSGDIYVMNATGSGVTRLTSGSDVDREPAWSPDGTKIAFQRQAAGTSSFDLFVVNADGTGLTQLTSSGVAKSPTWSPEGTKLAFESAREVVVMDADGTDGISITNNFAFDGYPAWGH